MLTSKPKIIIDLFFQVLVSVILTFTYILIIFYSAISATLDSSVSFHSPVLSPFLDTSIVYLEIKILIELLSLHDWKCYLFGSKFIFKRTSFRASTDFK